MTVNVTNGKLSENELNAYIERANKKYSNKVIKSMDISLDGDFVDIEYHFDDVPFDRIRRITGYLVGTLDRFNDAKRSEVGDRVKHTS